MIKPLRVNAPGFLSRGVPSAVVMLVWLYSPTHAQAPPTPFFARPPDYYEVIITNNLFRPLGWTKPKPPPAFEVIATVMKSEGRHKALMRDTRTRQVHYASIGELAAGTVIEKIEPRRVMINQDGTSKVYTLPDF